ncbi:hypothetical protein Trydic_g7899 [Trypoxylus dichotomus]
MQKSNVSEHREPPTVRSRIEERENRFSNVVTEQTVCNGHNCVARSCFMYEDMINLLKNCEILRKKQNRYILEQPVVLSEARLFGTKIIFMRDNGPKRMAIFYRQYLEAQQWYPQGPSWFPGYGSLRTPI